MIVAATVTKVLTAVGAASAAVAAAGEGEGEGREDERGELLAVLL